jgi:hypothetical protein
MRLTGPRSTRERVHARRRSACLSRTRVSNPASQIVFSKSFCLEELVFK